MHRDSPKLGRARRRATSAGICAVLHWAGPRARQCLPCICTNAPVPSTSSAMTCMSRGRQAGRQDCTGAPEARSGRAAGRFGRRTDKQSGGAQGTVRRVCLLRRDWVAVLYVRTLLLGVQPLHEPRRRGALLSLLCQVPYTSSALLSAMLPNNRPHCFTKP